MITDLGKDLLPEMNGSCRSLWRISFPELGMPAGVSIQTLPAPRQAFPVARTQRSVWWGDLAAQCPSLVMWAHSVMPFCSCRLVGVEEPCTCLGSSNALESLSHLSLECSIHIICVLLPRYLCFIQQRQHVSDHSNSTESSRSGLLLESTQGVLCEFRGLSTLKYILLCLWDIWEAYSEGKVSPQCEMHD